MNDREILRESPLAHLRLDKRAAGAPADAAVTLAERRFVGQLNLRGDAADESFRKAVRETTGLELPTEPNTFTTSGERAALWLAFDEWLLLTPPDTELELADALRKAFGETFASVVDITCGHTVIVLGGRRARDVLAKGCTLDLHPRVFGPGRCAQTLIARSGATLRQLDDTPTYEIVVRRSFADYLWAWLEDAALEFGSAVTR